MQETNILTRKYGLLTAICMVVGTVIGSGIFFKSEEIIHAVGGNLWLGVVAWVVGGLIPLSFAYVFATLASRYERVGGFTDYTEKLIGKKAGYFVAWFMATIYLPAHLAILAQVSARFTVELFNINIGSGSSNYSAATFIIAAFYMIAIYTMNVLSPKIAGKFQVSTTFVKIVPLILMAIVGTIVGLVNGTTIENLSNVAIETASNPFFAAVVATAFTFGGWEACMSMNSEIKNSKRNLPIALIGGMLFVIVVYILYFIGIFGAQGVEYTASQGSNLAFTNIFGGVRRNCIIGIYYYIMLRNL